MGRPKGYGSLVSKTAQQGKVAVRCSEGKKLEGSALPSSSRVSFKASGEIHLGPQVLRGRPLEGLSKATQLCLMLFAHPSRYRPPSKKNSNDYDVGIAEYPLDELRPMYGAIFVSPWPVDGKIGRISVRGMTFQTDLFFAFRGLGRTPDLALQLALGHGSKGPWPHRPSIIVTSRG